VKPVSKTAFYCCGLRMEDAKRDRPVCGDTFAERFMSEEGLRFFRMFADETGPNSSNLVRHRIIDDVVRDALSADPRRRVVTIGAGFDTRPYRLNGGRWLELDAPELIAYKEERLPAADAKNELARISIDFDRQSLGDTLVGFATSDPVVFVIEGVLLYLDPPRILRLLETLRRLFPNHRVVCDLMTKAMFDRHAGTMQQKLAGADTALTVTEPDPADLFTRSGYLLVDRISIPEASVRAGLPPRIPVVILKTLLRTLYKGYTVCVFTVGDDLRA